MSTSISIKQLGAFSGPGGRVPIFGADTLDFSNETGWSDIQAPMNQTVMTWNGDKTPAFNFNFTIFAGVSPIKSRAQVHSAMKAMLSWAQHQAGPGDSAIPPPAVRCIIPNYISSKGAILNCTCSAKGPWESGGTPYPTSCTFSGTFLISPFYKADTTQDISQNNQAFTAEAIAGGMFAL